MYLALDSRRRPRRLILKCIFHTEFKKRITSDQTSIQKTKTHEWSRAWVMNCLVPTTATGLFLATTSANSTIAVRTTSALEPGTTRDTKPSERSASSAPNVRADNASSWTSDAFADSFGMRASVPVSAAIPTSTSLMQNAASEAAQRTSTAHSKSSASPIAVPCIAAITGCGMRAGAPIAFWKARRWARVRRARRPVSVCSGRACKSVTVQVDRWVALGSWGGGGEGRGEKVSFEKGRQTGKRRTVYTS